MLNVLSYGGGVQSNAILVLAKRGIIKIDAAIFVELDSENPSTIEYVREFGEPYCVGAGIRFIRINVSLIQMIKENPSFPPVPFRDVSGNLFGRRQCTNHAKVRPFRRALRALMKENNVSSANVAYGISSDEIFRIRDSDVKYIKNVYPLIDLKLTRRQCKDIIAGELPVPMKSSCWFCPFASKSFQRQILKNNPHLSGQAAMLQDLIDDARSRNSADKLMVIRCDMAQEDMFDDVCGGTCHS